MRYGFEVTVTENKRSPTGPADTDEALVQRLQKGDLSPFETLFHRYKCRIYSLCYRLIYDRSEAEDLTQEVFLQLFRKVTSFRAESSFSTWLHRLAINTALMYVRKKPDIPPGRMAYEIADFPSHKPSGILDRITLERALAELPQGYRTIVVLHDMEGYDHREIATLLNCSVGTSKSQLHKARMKLRSLLRR